MNVELPDGRVVAFPESMSQAQVEDALRSINPGDKSAAAPAATSPPASPSANPAQISGPMRYLDILGSGEIKGAGTALSIPGTLERLGVNYLENPIRSHFGYAPIQNYLFPGYEDISSFLQAHNLINNPAIAPQGTAENLLSAAGEGLGSGAVFAPLGGVAPMLATSVAGSEAGELSREAGAPMPVQAAAGLAAGLGTQGAASLLARNIKSVAKDLGTSETLEQAGVAVQDSLQNWRDNVMGKKLTDAAAPLDAKIPGVAQTDPAELASRVDELLARGGQAANAVRDFLNRTSQSGGVLGEAVDKVAARLSPTSNTPSWFKGAPGAGTLTWEEARKLRTELGTNLRTAKPAERAAIEYLYGGATEDLGTTANTFGAGDEFQRFNKISTDLHQFDSGPVESALSANQPADAASRLLAQARRGGSNLAAILSEAPDAIDELAAAHLRLNPDGKAWQKLSPEAQQALITNPVDRAIVSSTHQAVPSKIEMIDRSIRGSLVGAGGGAALHLLGTGIDPYTAGGVGEVLGAAWPYVLRGGYSAVRNPLYGAAGGIAATGNALQPPQ